jgi:alanine racemase
VEHTSKITLSKTALQYNLDFLKNEIGKDVLISSVVKGNAYGHGIETLVPVAEACGVAHFSVYSAYEALEVQRSLQRKIPIMIMGYIDHEQLEWAIENEIEFYVFDVSRLQQALDVAAKRHKKALLHIELETGMNRTGFNEETLVQYVFPMLESRKTDYVFKGLCTHFAGAESIANYVRIEEQKKAFLKLKRLFLRQGLIPEFLHTCCSAAAMRLPDMRFNMVRIGILQYGLWPNQEIKIEFLRKHRLREFNLHRVLTWSSKIMVTKQVSMGEFISYGSSYQASRDMLVGIVPVGYVNGYSRELSNSGRVIVNGVRTGVIGMVNMNCLAIDLTDIPDAGTGDEVILIGERGGFEISVASFSETSNQLNYESLSRLPMDIPRSVE